MEALQNFYAVATGLSFTLLGLWWVVVALHLDVWMNDPGLRRLARNVSQYFVVPGLMSLVSLIAVSETVLWRFGFGVGALLGLVESMRAATGRSRAISLSGAPRAVAVVAAVMYLIAGALAVDPTLPAAAGVDLSALEVEALLVALLLFLGVNVVWTFFAHPPGKATTGG